MYRLTTIAGLADQFPDLGPIDPSWLPDGTVHIPGGGLVPAPPPPASSSPAALVVPFVVAGAVALALGLLVARR